ncbi:MAG: hypothetical protein QOE87_4672 [Gaiellales bacterium]|nr:hypothetical protein [Gaiellales bacterium]
MIPSLVQPAAAVSPQFLDRRRVQEHCAASISAMEDDEQQLCNTLPPALEIGSRARSRDTPESQRPSRKHQGS